MKTLSEIEKELDALIDPIPSKRHKATKTKRAIKLTTLLGVILSVAIVSGVLLTLYSVYYADMEGSIDLEGQTSQLLWDGSFLTDQVTSIDMDINNLTANDSVSFIHTATCANGDFWDISFDTANITFSNSSDEFYGFELSIEPTSVLLYPNSNESFYFNYSLDKDFQHTDNALPFDLQVIIETHLNTAPTANDDTYEIKGMNWKQDCYVLANDEDTEDDSNDLTIVSVTQPDEGSCWIVDSSPDYIVYESNEFGTPTSFTYTIEDSGGLQDTATVEMT